MKIKEKKQLNEKIENILIDFGNHYILATQGSRLKIKHFIEEILKLIEIEAKKAEIIANIDGKNFIEETGLTEDLLPVFKDHLEDLEEELKLLPQ